MLEKVIDIISKYTEVPKEEITPDTNMVKDLGLASIDFIDMMCDFEDTFHSEVPESDFRRLTTVQKIVDYIELKTSEVAAAAETASGTGTAAK